MKKLILFLLLIVACAPSKIRISDPTSVEECEALPKSYRTSCLVNYARKLEKERVTQKPGQEQKAKDPAEAKPPAPAQAEQQEAQAPTLSVLPASMEGAQPHILVRRVAPRTRLGICVAGASIAIHNKTNKYAEVVSSSALEPCGESYLVLQWVVKPDGSVQEAWLIPPGRRGHYYFNADAGGEGQQDYWLVSYNQSHLQGEYEESPRTAIGRTETFSVDVPFDNDWWEARFYPEHFPARLRFKH